MVGTQALGAFRNSTGITVRTYDVTQAVKDNTRSLIPGPVAVAYSNYSAAVTADGTVTISGTVTLAQGQATKLNLVWNRGSAVVAITAALLGHNFDSDNLASTAVVEMSSGKTTGGGEIPNKDLKDIHGILNAVSWGILLPIGVMSARYLRPFEFADPAWFYLHVFCQVTGYAGGTAGWVLGLRLQKYANPIKYYHRNMGIAIWAIATFQVLLAILLRPKPKAKARPFWNVVHHTLGYAIIILAIINIFEGIDLLGEDKWKRVYITILVILGLIAIVLELITWFHWMQKRERKHKRHSVLIGDREPET
ncbi:hypothetical protein M758_1G218500 [Ceratodon purpureus]|nr:hypothetical protein KC19_1G201300 [Ceratodon purpureus]KAG0630983.1 hypothetical protein M758_1G218500 [Ceratodon purpureus]